MAESKNAQHDCEKDGSTLLDTIMPYAEKTDGKTHEEIATINDKPPKEVIEAESEMVARSQQVGKMEDWVEPSTRGISSLGNQDTDLGSESEQDEPELLMAGSWTSGPITKKKALQPATQAAIKAQASLERSANERSATAGQRDIPKALPSRPDSRSSTSARTQPSQNKQGYLQAGISRLMGASGGPEQQAKPAPSISYAELQRLRSEVAQYKDGYNEQFRKTEALKKRNADLEQWLRKRDTEIQSLVQENQDWLLQIGLQQNEIDELKHGAARIKDSALEWKRSMNSQELFLGHQADDAAVLNRLEPLLRKIKTWSMNFMEVGTEPETSGNFEIKCLHVMPVCATIQELQNKISANRSVKRLFVRGWASYVMSTMLFRTLSTPEQPGSEAYDYWLPRDLSVSFKAVEDAIYCSKKELATPEEFNNWRAFTSMLLTKSIRPDLDERLTQSELYPETRANADAIVEEAANRVMRVIHGWGKNGADLLVLKATLVDIYQQAIKCSHFLRKHRALWSVLFPTARPAAGIRQARSVLFDPNLMSDKNDSEYNESTGMPEVHIVISPLLLKRGNLDGQRYQEVHTALKAEVSMKSS